MNKKLAIAVAAQVALMLAGLVSPLAVKTTGTTVYLETRPVDPRALFRGDYVTLDFAIGQQVAASEVVVANSLKLGKPLYVTVTTDRPAELVSVSPDRPDLEEGQACLTARVGMFGDSQRVEFPQLAQYFVPEGEGLEIERQLGEGLLAEVRVSPRCSAVLVGLEPR